MISDSKFVQISRILHAGYLFESNGTKILFDPIFENPFSHNCYAFPDVQFDHQKIQKIDFSAVFISHYHDDHCSFDSLIHINRKTPIYIFCVFDEMILMIKQLGFENVFQLHINQKIQIGFFKITTHRALDANVDSIFQIQIFDLNILNVVDSWIDDETLNVLAAKSPWDLILWPFQTMREIEVIAPRRSKPAMAGLPVEWLDQLEILNPKYIVPSSCQFRHEVWSWYNRALFPVTYQNFETEIKLILPEATVIRLNPSVSFILNKNEIQFVKPSDWIIPVGEQNVDYDYKSDLIPPSTSDISKNFLALTEGQTNTVFKYCEFELIEKYNSLEQGSENYFNQNLIWKLSVYDHEGQGTDFYYLIQNMKIKTFVYQGEPISWLTEIPISKFYGGLKHGESLTSMYIRINDYQFDSEIEKIISDVDLVEDPLIRCLFNQNFGSYQAAQLKRLQMK